MGRPQAFPAARFEPTSLIRAERGMPVLLGGPEHLIGILNTADSVRRREGEHHQCGRFERHPALHTGRRRRVVECTVRAPPAAVSSGRSASAAMDGRDCISLHVDAAGAAGRAAPPGGVSITVMSPVR